MCNGSVQFLKLPVNDDTICAYLIDNSRMPRPPLGELSQHRQGRKRPQGSEGKPVEFLPVKTPNDETDSASVRARLVLSRFDAIRNKQ